MTVMSVEDQVRKTRQALNQVACQVAHLTNTLVSKVVETPPLYLNTKLRVLTAIGSLPKGVVELQQAWEKVLYEIQRIGVTLPLEEEEEEESEPRHKVPKRTPTGRGGRKKKETPLPPSPPPPPPSSPIHLEASFQDHA